MKDKQLLLEKLNQVIQLLQKFYKYNGWITITIPKKVVFNNTFGFSLVEEILEEMYYYFTLDYTTPKLKIRINSYDFCKNVEDLSYESIKTILDCIKLHQEELYNKFIEQRDYQEKFYNEIFNILSTDDVDEEFETFKKM